MRTWAFIATGAFAAAAFTAPASAQCSGAPCASRGAVRGTSVVPPPDGSEFRLRGDLFSRQLTDVPLATNGFSTYNLGFNVNFGFGNVSSINVHENGFVSFNAPAVRTLQSLNTASAATPTLPFVPVSDLRRLGVPVIAPFYADLVKGAGAGDGQLGVGDVVVQYGDADPFDDGGAFKLSDARSAVRITWYGLGIDGNSNAAMASAAPAGQVYAQLLISSDLNGASSFAFRYGPLDSPGQAGYGSIAGFSLGSNFLQFSGPYVDGIPTFFEFHDGRFVGDVPEPLTWLQMILGFALLGFAARTNRLRGKPEPA